jgi:hypothetical protein
MFILSNLDRVSYGLQPIVGLSTSLNSAAQLGVTNDSDPDPTPDLPPDWLGWGSNWAGAWANAPLAYYEWMYDDGPGGPNLDCASAGDPGCWGHRQNVLAFNNVGAVVMGAAAGLDSSGSQGYAMTTVATSDSSTSWTALTYTWAEALADINGGTPVVSGISPSSGPTTGGTLVTVTGTGFTGATHVKFGSVAATSFTVVSSTEITAVAPAQATSRRNIFIITPGGTSASVPADLFRYS